MTFCFFTVEDSCFSFFFFFQAEDGIRDFHVTGVQTCALPICLGRGRERPPADHCCCALASLKEPRATPSEATERPPAGVRRGSRLSSGCCIAQSLTAHTRWRETTHRGVACRRS